MKNTCDITACEIKKLSNKKLGESYRLTEAAIINHGRSKYAFQAELMIYSEEPKYVIYDLIDELNEHWSDGYDIYIYDIYDIEDIGLSKYKVTVEVLSFSTSSQRAIARALKQLFADYGYSYDLHLDSVVSIIPESVQKNSNNPINENLELYDCINDTYIGLKPFYRKDVKYLNSVGAEYCEAPEGLFIPMMGAYQHDIFYDVVDKYMTENRIKYASEDIIHQFNLKKAKPLDEALRGWSNQSKDLTKAEAEELKPEIRKSLKNVKNTLSDYRSVYGWNSIIENAVWNDLKKRGILTTFPNHLYNVIRDVMKEMGESLNEGATSVEDITNILHFYSDIDEEYYDIDVCTKEDIGNDITYRKLVKSVEEAEKFNYHSDYWGSADSYQTDNVDLMTELEQYVGKRVSQTFDDSKIEFTLEGILIDKQYNSISHTCVLASNLVDNATNESLKETYEDTKSISIPSGTVSIGDKIKIINMKGEPQYTGKEGKVTHIDDIGQIHGTWGGCAVIPEEDEIEIINESLLKEDWSKGILFIFKVDTDSLLTAAKKGRIRLGAVNRYEKHNKSVDREPHNDYSVANLDRYVADSEDSLRFDVIKSPHSWRQYSYASVDRAQSEIHFWLADGHADGYFKYSDWGGKKLFNQGKLTLEMKDYAKALAKDLKKAGIKINQAKVEVANSDIERKFGTFRHVANEALNNGKTILREWEDNGYMQHVWVLLKPEQSYEEAVARLGEPEGSGDWTHDDEYDFVLDYYFDDLDSAQDFAYSIPSEYYWDEEETDTICEGWHYVDDDEDEEYYDLVGIDGNAFCVMGYVSNALKQEGLRDLVEPYRKDAMSSDYNHLLAVSIDYINKANEAHRNNN